MILLLVLVVLVYFLLLCRWGGAYFDETCWALEVLVWLVIIMWLWWPPRPPLGLLLVLAAGRF